MLVPISELAFTRLSCTGDPPKEGTAPIPVPRSSALSGLGAQRTGKPQSGKERRTLFRRRDRRHRDNLTPDRGGRRGDVEGGMELRFATVAPAPASRAIHRVQPFAST